MFEENLRIDYSQYVLGMRLNFWIATLVSAAALLRFAAIQRRWSPPGSWRRRGTDSRTAPRGAGANGRG
jgi:hypothetical protein